ncbi:hypothetical protein L286_23620 [Sphingobium sp. HDIP04]|nr:hypothetical protein L286_23620 [Sphingobium sp. HDIP04]
MRAAGLSSVPGAQRLEAFAAAPPIHLHPNQLYIVRRFLTRFPNPPSAAELIERLGSKYMDQHEDARERGIREAIERERQREAYVRRLLEAERAPRCRPHREFMDKATVAALSGVRL